MPAEYVIECNLVVIGRLKFILGDFKVFPAGARESRIFQNSDVLPYGMCMPLGDGWGATT